MKLRFGDIILDIIESPPSRAAWIEITSCLFSTAAFAVAAFTGGVD